MPPTCGGRSCRCQARRRHCSCWGMCACRTAHPSRRHVPVPSAPASYQGPFQITEGGSGTEHGVAPRWRTTIATHGRRAFQDMRIYVHVRTPSGAQAPSAHDVRCLLLVGGERGFWGWGVGVGVGGREREENHGGGAEACTRWRGGDPEPLPSYCTVGPRSVHGMQSASCIVGHRTVLRLGACACADPFPSQPCWLPSAPMSVSPPPSPIVQDHPGRRRRGVRERSGRT